MPDTHTHTLIHYWLFTSGYMWVCECVCKHTPDGALLVNYRMNVCYAGSMLLFEFKNEYQVLDQLFSLALKVHHEIIISTIYVFIPPFDSSLNVETNFLLVIPNA